MVGNDNYILIQGWMVNELQLKGNELLLYALIYGFTQDGVNRFSGSIVYMMDWLQCGSKHTVINALKSLENKGLIEIEQCTNKKGKSNNYRVVQNVHLPSAKSAPPIVQNVHHPSAKSAPNNNIYNNNYNNIYNSARSKNAFHNFDQRNYDYDDLEERLLSRGK